MLPAGSPVKLLTAEGAGADELSYDAWEAWVELPESVPAVDAGAPAQSAAMPS